MKQNVSSRKGVINTFKWAVALLLVALGLIGNYYYAHYSLSLRIFIITTLGVMALILASQTRHGLQFRGFIQQARNELRKIVWPTRAETLQMTSIVLVVVSIMGLILWGVDALLLKMIGWLTGYGA